MNIHPITYIISAYRPDRDFVSNRIAHDALRQLLQVAGYGIKQVDGVYKGQKEKSFVVVGATDNAILSLAWTFSQESVLKLHGDRHADLLYTNGVVEPLGKFVAVGQAEALKHDSYTYCPVNDTFYIIEVATHAY